MKKWMGEREGGREEEPIRQCISREEHGTSELEALTYVTALQFLHGTDL